MKAEELQLAGEAFRRCILAMQDRGAPAGKVGRFPHETIRSWGGLRVRRPVRYGSATMAGSEAMISNPPSSLMRPRWKGSAAWRVSASILIGPRTVARGAAQSRLDTA
ncbi:hypothetical protein D3C86_2007610 [compost metagenome]